jgi:hypothetical protein
MTQIVADFQKSVTAGKGFEFETKILSLVSNFLELLIAVDCTLKK